MPAVKSCCTFNARGCKVEICTVGMNVIAGCKMTVSGFSGCEVAMFDGLLRGVFQMTANTLKAFPLVGFSRLEEKEQGENRNVILRCMCCFLQQVHRCILILTSHRTLLITLR